MTGDTRISEKVQVWLPRAPNSEYAAVDFGEPRLVDKKGGPVACEVEQGIFDSDKSKTEVRFGRGSAEEGGGEVGGSRHFIRKGSVLAAHRSRPSDGTSRARQETEKI